MTLADVADELYGVPPEEFVETREARRKDARAGGDRDLARAVGKLRKPSTAAWVVNTLVRREPDELAQLVELGAALRDAQGSLDGDELKELSQQRHRVVAALTRQARSLASDLGRPVSDAVAGQVQDTLRAAIADEDAGQAVLSGRLLTALSHRGLARSEVSGAVADLGDDGSAAAPRRKRARKGRTTAEERRRREREQALAKARADLEEAEVAAAEADDEARAAGDRLADVTARREEARAQVEDLEQRLRRAEAEAASLGAELRDAQRRRDAGERRSGRARTARDRARARVERLAADTDGAAPSDRPGAG
ncbi:hypothetical protein [Blastococcus saxobsidens]|uniref:Uncharacterized protein n=1 Tax=Blastococcus saxobsidens (strain DD2) TaxID=1146883 RepID=H6RNB4_BLASD|nr:hypothetical protein [Blastococcus saxobsidens]CCG02662.1 conserved protein of unknown function [Blastococcus saxobsidens DD2]